MSGNVDNEARRAWVSRVLGITLPVVGDDALRAALLARIGAAAATAKTLPPDQIAAFVAQAKAAKALADTSDLLAAEIAVEQLEAFGKAPASATPVVDTAAVTDRRRTLLAQVAALQDPAYADPSGLAALAQARSDAGTALQPELPTPEQFGQAEQAIAAFAAAQAAAASQAAARRAALVQAVAGLQDPPFAAEAALAALKAARDAASAAIADEHPTPDQFTQADQAVADFGVKLDAERQRIVDRRQALLQQVETLVDPAHAAPAALDALKVERDKAAAALADATPTTQQFAEAEATIAAFAAALQAEAARVTEQRAALLVTLGQLLTPAFADQTATDAMQVERAAATAALADALPTPAQFAEAARAIAAFAPLVEAAKQKAIETRAALLVTVGQLADPAHGDAAGLAALKGERDKATAALADPVPTAQQIADANAAIAAFGTAVAAETARVTEQRRVLLETVGQLLTPPFADQAATDALQVERAAATAALTDALPTPAQFTEAARAIAAFATALAAATARITARCHDLRDKLAALADPAGADADEKQGTKVPRDAATLALTPETPTPDQFAAAEAALKTLARLVKQAANTSALASAGRPQAAAAARDALKAFKQVNGDAEVTPKMVADAKVASDAADAKVKAALAAWQATQVLPTGTPQEIEAKRVAAENTAKDWNDAVQERDAAAKRETALFGQHALVGALAHGPLSAESGRPFDDGTAKLLLDGFKDDPHLAKTAVDAAGTAKHPETVAQGLAWAAGKTKAGFPSSTGTHWTDPEYSRGYAGNLLKMAGNVGPEYYNGLDAYLNGGEQFKDQPLGNEAAMQYSQVAQQRSVAVASALLKPDGSVDLTTDAAKNAIGHALYHPTSVTNATPAFSAQLLKTVAFLQDGTTGPQAASVLQGVGVPEAGKGGETLVRRALTTNGPGAKAATDPITANDARTAVLASMMKPLDQGPVGSCFSTAPARLVREERPLEAMKAFAQVAGDGTYKPAHGEKVQVVTKLPANEDPILRGWEYSLATSAVREGATNEKVNFAGNLGAGIDQLKAAVVPAGPNQDKIWQTKKKKLKGYVENAFTFTYDPTADVKDANDGSSSKGRYVVQRKGGGPEISTKDEFINQMVDVAMKSMGLKTPEEETKVRDVVKSDAFIAAVCPGKYKPWELPSGGFSNNVVKALGGGTSYTEMLPEAPKTTPPQAEGARTREVLQSFLNGLGTTADPMVTINTEGMHSFNALPNDPSLQALKGANPTETAQKVQTNLIDKGQAVKNTDLSADRAAWMFDQQVEHALAGQSDPALLALIKDGAAAHRPSAPMKPAAVGAAVNEAMKAFHEKVAETRATAWKATEETAGKTIDGPALDKKKAELKTAFDASVANVLKSSMIQDLGAPEFTIADTNWGNSQNHTFFVVAPDPMTGDPVLWKKTEPPGSLEPAGREWVDAQWTVVK